MAGDIVPASRIKVYPPTAKTPKKMLTPANKRRVAKAEELLKQLAQNRKQQQLLQREYDRLIKELRSLRKAAWLDGRDVI